MHQGWILAPFLLMALPGLTGCSEPPPESIHLKIGVLVYNEGETQSCCGNATVDAIEMVRSQLEATGGLLANGKPVDVSIIPEGTRNVPEDAVAAATRLVNQEQVHVLIGPQHSGDAIPVGEIAQKAGVVMISPMSTNPRTTKGRPNVFRIGFLDGFQGKVLADLAYQDLGIRRAAILYDVARPYNKGIAGRFKTRFSELGGTVAVLSTYVTGEELYTEQLKVLRAVEPELLLLPNHNNDIMIQGPLVRQAGIDAVLLGTDAWNEQLLAPMPEFDGAYKTAHWSPAIDSPANRTFVEQYRSRFGTEPNNTAALTWDAFQILFEAVRQAGSAEPASIRDALYDMGPFEGLSGKIDYLDSGDPVKSVAVLSINGGRVDFHKMVSP